MLKRTIETVDATMLGQSIEKPYVVQGMTVACSANNPCLFRVGEWLEFSICPNSLVSGKSSVE